MNRITEIYNYIERKEVAKRKDKEFFSWIASSAIDRIIAAQVKNKKTPECSVVQS